MRGTTQSLESACAASWVGTSIESADREPTIEGSSLGGLTSYFRTFFGEFFMETDTSPKLSRCS